MVETLLGIKSTIFHSTLVRCVVCEKIFKKSIIFQKLLILGAQRLNLMEHPEMC